VTSAPTPGVVTVVVVVLVSVEAAVVVDAVVVEAVSVVEAAVVADAVVVVLRVAAAVGVVTGCLSPVLLLTTVAVAVAMAEWNPPGEETSLLDDWVAVFSAAPQLDPPKISAKSSWPPVYLVGVCELAAWLRRASAAI